MKTIIISSWSNHKIVLKINFCEEKFEKIFKYWSDLTINFQFQSFNRVYDQNWLNSKFCRGGPQVEPKPTSSGKNLLILWNTTLPIAAQLMSRHCIFMWTFYSEQVSKKVIIKRSLNIFENSFFKNGIQMTIRFIITIWFLRRS